VALQYQSLIGALSKEDEQVDSSLARRACYVVNQASDGFGRQLPNRHSCCGGCRLPLNMTVTFYLIFSQVEILESVDNCDVIPGVCQAKSVASFAAGSL
jgi:hypothetical protein